MLLKVPDPGSRGRKQKGGKEEVVLVVEEHFACTKAGLKAGGELERTVRYDRGE